MNEGAKPLELEEYIRRTAENLGSLPAAPVMCIDVLRLREGAERVLTDISGEVGQHR